MMEKKQARKCIKKIVSPADGFTIIESLVGILIASLLLVAIAPVVTLSVATRVQAKRTQLATQAARSLVDALRTQQMTANISGSCSGACVPVSTTTLSSQSAPTASGTLTCTQSTTTPTPLIPCTAPTAPSGTSLFCADFDGSNCSLTSPVDVVVQAFGYNMNATSSSYIPYQLGIRVYSVAAFNLNEQLSRNNASGHNEYVTQTTYAGTGGTGTLTTPIVEMTADIASVSSSEPQYSNICSSMSTTNTTATCSQ